MKPRNISIVLLILILLVGTIFFVFKKYQTAPTNSSQAENQSPTNSVSTNSTKVIKFSGKVTNNQKFFEKEIGSNLFFRLNPTGSGWMISVGSKTSRFITPTDFGGYNDFAGVVTPPYHGINNTYIEGWHFRNSDNTGPNVVGPKNVNAPGEIREFDFVLNDADYKKASEALDKMLWSYSYSEQEVNEASIIHDKLIKGHGKLTIRDLKLNNLVAGKQAGIESIKFDVELNFP